MGQKRQHGGRRPSLPEDPGLHKEHTGYVSAAVPSGDRLVHQVDYASDTDLPTYPFNMTRDRIFGVLFGCNAGESKQERHGGD
jgi:hypothetical protein